MLFEVGSDEYAQIFHYPTKEEREYMHRSYAGEVGIYDFGAPNMHHEKTIDELREIKAHDVFVKSMRTKKYAGDISDTGGSKDIVESYTDLVRKFDEEDATT